MKTSSERENSYVFGFVRKPSDYIWAEPEREEENESEEQERSDLPLDFGRIGKRSETSEEQMHRVVSISPIDFPIRRFSAAASGTILDRLRTTPTLEDDEASLRSEFSFN